MKEDTLLIVDDNPINLKVIADYLEAYDFNILTAVDGEDALTTARETMPDLILLDVMMPGIDGFEVCRRLKSDAELHNIPVIFMTSLVSTEDKVHGFEVGAVDYVTKPVQQEEVLARIKTHLTLKEQRAELEAVNAALAKRAAQLETSIQVAQQVTSILNLDSLLTKMAHLVRAQFNYYCVGVWLLDESRDNIILRTFAGRGSVDEGAVGFVLPVDAEPSIIGLVCREQQPYLANDVRNDPHYLFWEALPDARAELTLPLQFGSARSPETRLLGVLDIQCDSVGAFAPADIRVLQMLANQISVAIHNAELYTEVTRFNEELEDKVRERTAELRRAYEQLELLDRNKSDFITVVSHELRTPLAVFVGYSQFLLGMPVVEEEGDLAQVAEGMYRSSKRLEEIVNAMLEVAKIDNRALQLRFRTVSLADTLQRVHRDFRSILDDRNLTLDLEGLEGLPSVEADSEEIHKVFVNLTGNAIKYTPDGGRISICGELMPRNGDEVPKEFVHVVVSDTGIGIDPALHELIFTKFYQAGEVSLHSSGKTKFKGGGPGLGLALCKGIIEAHGGRIWVESPGHDEDRCPGSDFHVVLPVQPQPHQASSEEPLSEWFERLSAD